MVQTGTHTHAEYSTVQCIRGGAGEHLTCDRIAKMRTFFHGQQFTKGEDVLQLKRQVIFIQFRENRNILQRE